MMENLDTKDNSEERKNNADFSGEKIHKTTEIDAGDQSSSSFWGRKIFGQWIFRFGVVFLVVLLIAGALFFLWQRQRSIDQQNAEPDVAAQLPADTTNSFVNDVSGVSPAVEQNQDNAVPPGVISKSENFQLKEVSFGGSAELLSNESESLQLKISDVRSEILTSKDGSQSEVLIRWKTNKMASSSVDYDKSGISKKLSEGGFGYSHALILTDLEQSKRYVFVISAQDRWGNQTNSENFSIYTGAKVASIFELITQQFEDIFGWAIKK
jgi:hypothetical protein